MKRTRKIWLTVTLSAVFALAAAGVLAACGKSKQPISLTLDAGDGGSLATTTYTLPEGDDLSAFLADKEPSPIEGLTFAGWYLGGELIEEGDTMPATATTLTAKYTADCTVLLYTEGEAEGEFGDPQTLKKSGIYQEALDVGDLITIPEGYSIDEEKSDARTVTSLGAATTVSVYLVRNTYTLRFVPDLPAGAEVEADDLIVSARHGVAVTAPDASSFDVPETLRLLGWATEEGGEVLYEAGEEFSVSGALVLHGVWIEGYTDLYGGDDIIFFSGTEENVAYLVRGGMEFEGVHTGDEFRFVPDDGEPLEGKVIGHSFAYTRSALEGTYTYYSGYLSDVDDPIIETETLVLDGTFNATYTHDEEGETVVDKGIYYPGESRGEYILETDDYAYTFILSEAEGKPVFSFYDIAEGSFNMGVFASVDGYFSIDDDIYLSLDGVGGASILDYVDYIGYKGKYDIVAIYGEEVPEIHAEIEGYGEIDCIIVPLQSGTTVYVEKDSYAGTYNTTADGKDVTIELSGYSALIGATITEGTNVTADAYWVRESEVFGTLVDIYDGSEVKYTYKVDEKDGQLSLKPFDGGNFTEYLQLEVNQSGNAGLYYPVILFYDEAAKGTDLPAGAKRAEVYNIVVDSETSSRTLMHAASGYYTVKQLSDELSYYTYKQTSKDDKYTGNPVFETIGCLTSSVSASDGYLDVYYIFEADDEELYILINEETEDGKGGYIWYREVGITGMGSLYVTADGTVYEGSISAVSVEGIEDTIYMDLQAFDTEARAYIHFYFVVHVHEGENVDDDPTYTYIVAEDAPHTYEYSDQYGDSGDGETLFVDGAGFAIYTDAEGNEVVGAYEDTGRETAFGDTIYTFVATGASAVPKSFEFILYYNYVDLGIFGTYEEAYFYLYDEGLNGTLTGEGGIKLELDGFYYWAEYTDADGNVYSGNYFLLDEDYICFMDMEVTGDEFYFIVEGKTITLDGDSGSSSQFAESYEVVDDSYLPVKDMEGYTVIFDEDGTVTLYDADDEEAGTGTWTLTDEDDIYDVVLTMGETEITWTVQLIANDYYMKYLCVLCNEEMEGNFVGPGLSVLYMDGFGYGSYIDEMGFYYDIYTTVVNDKYLFISEYNGDFEYFVSYNTAARTFSLVDNSAYYATFYSTDLLGSVVFADGLYLDGELYGYYVVEDGAEKATVFVQDETEAYVEEEFTLPKDSQTYVLDEVTYYRWNEGEEIAIDGTALFHSGEIELAVTLTFTPDGTAALNAPASITYQDEGGQDVTVDGFELVIELDDETYELVMTLYDANRIDYPVYELTWNPDNETENDVIVIGTFLYTDLIEDITGDDNGIYYGHFALGDIAVSEDQYWIVLEATDLNGEELGCFVDDLDALKTETTNKNYGTMYEAEIDGTDDNEYVLDFFLITEDEDPWTEGSGTPYLLIYAVTLDQMIDGTDGVQNLVLYTSTCVYVNAFSNVLEVGEMNVGLYLRLSSGGIGYLEPDDAIFADDGSWIIWGDVPNEQSTLTWLLNLTIDEETGLITAFTATQGDYGYFGDTTTTYAVGFFYTLSRGDDGESLVLNEILVYSMGNIQDGRVYPFDDMTITENDDGTWTVETADATYTVTIKLNDTQNGFNITVEEQTKDAGAGVQG